MTETGLSEFKPPRAERVREDQVLLRRRKRADARLRIYGVVALGVTGLFLAALIIDIFRTGLPAFFQHSARLDVELSGAAIDPDGKRTPEALAAADYGAVVRAALAKAVPGVEGRAAKKQLNELISTGAADAVRERVTSDPALIGTSITMPLLLSDNADLFYKGADTGISTRSDTLGRATPSGTTGEITISSSAGDFTADLAAIKDEVAKRAAKLGGEIARLERAGTEAAKLRIAELSDELKALKAQLEAPGTAETLDSHMPSRLVAINGGIVKITRLGPREITGDVMLALGSADEAAAGTWQVITYETPEADRNIPDCSVVYLEKLKADGRVENGFNWLFFTAGDSREPELAGIRGSLIGSILTLAVTLALCLPIGVLAAIYLEKYAPKNRLTDFIEININNLAAVPSIVFGLLGLAVFLNFFGMPRSAPLVGGLVLGLLVMPTIIIAARAALRAVPPSIEEGALGIGASKQQAIFHHVLPLAIPGIMTGTIIGMAHALGETAPLLMIGMIAFIVDIPKSFTEAATVLPVQIYLWSDLPEPAFQAKTAAAIIVLLAVLFVMNGMAIWVRNKFEKRW